MHNVLLIQMARMGDFLQSTPLIYGIKKTNAPAKVWVLVDKSIEALALHNPYIDEVLTIDMKKIFDLTAGENDLKYLYCNLKEVFYFLKNLRFDRVYNINCSLLTAHMSKIPAGNKVCGYRLDRTGTILKKDQWFIFMNQTVKYLTLAPFNLVDSFFYLTGSAVHHPKRLIFKVDACEIDKAREMSANENISESDIVIALQLSTRSRQRQWPVKHFVELAVKLLEIENVRIILLGAEEDKDLGDKFHRFFSDSAGYELQQRVHNFISKTAISELSGLLQRTDLLITGDTGTMHLAAAVGCRILALFIGPAQVNHTGPYGPGHYIIQTYAHCSPCIEGHPQCEDFHCRSLIKPNLVLSLAKQILLNEKVYLTCPSSIKVFKSRLDAWGIVYESCFKKPAAIQEIQNICYREIGKGLINPDYRAVSPKTGYGQMRESIENDSALKKEIENILKLSEILLHDYYRDPFGLTKAKMNSKMSFWHPWVDCCREFKKNSLNFNTNYNFPYGIQTGTRLLKSLLLSHYK